MMTHNGMVDLLFQIGSIDPYVSLWEPECTGCFVLDVCYMMIPVQVLCYGDSHLLCCIDYLKCVHRLLLQSDPFPPTHKCIRKMQMFQHGYNMKVRLPIKVVGWLGSPAVSKFESLRVKRSVIEAIVVLDKQNYKIFLMELYFSQSDLILPAVMN